MITYKSPLPEITIKYKKGDFKKIKIERSKDAYELFKELFNADTIEYTEESVVLFLNRLNATIGFVKLSSGGMIGTVVDKRVVMTLALQCGAYAIILAHNHPSGNLKASQADIDITKRLKEAGKLLDIDVLEHIIITDNGYTSMADEGLL
jgi:DNA repair protein RadC